MTTGRLTKGLTALSVAAVAFVGVQAPAMAQAPPADRPCGPGQGQPPAYPPGQPGSASASDDTPVQNQRITFTAAPGTFDPGSQARACLRDSSGRVFSLGLVTVNPNGSATISFNIPSDAAAGTAVLSFQGVRGGSYADVSDTITIRAAGASAAAPGRTGSTGSQARSAALPRTGADQLVPLSVLGGSLVLAGAGVVVASRRRREDLGV
jgi:LPXTG-motif cell wall-anchored protein